MTIIDIANVDKKWHVKYFAEPLSKALQVLSSDGDDLYIDDERVPLYSRVPEARHYFRALYTECKCGGFDIATATPEEIDSLVLADETYCLNTSNWIAPKQRRLSGKCPVAQKQVFKVLAKLFDYDNFVNGRGWQIIRRNCIKRVSLKSRNVKWGASIFQKDVVKRNHLRFCPYCNAETTFMLTGLDTASGESRSALDHFYPKSVFPYLGVSLFNLIPTCGHCNSGLKREKVPWRNGARNWIHPYAEDFHSSARFRFTNVNVAALYGNANQSLAIELQYKNGQLGDMAEGLSIGLQLKDVYNQAYSDEINDLPGRLQLALSNAPSIMEDLSISYDSQSRLSTMLNCSLNSQRINQERLSKMTIDLVEQLCGWDFACAHTDTARYSMLACKGSR